MIADFLDCLADPVDGSALTMDKLDVANAPGVAGLHSASGQTYPITEEGFVDFSGAEECVEVGDSAVMVSARETLLSRGIFAPFVEAVTTAVGDALEETTQADQVATILDAGAGTGYYLAHTLDEIADTRGIGLDASSAAAALLAQVHPRAMAVLADMTARLPLRDNSVDIITSVFSPVNSAEFRRVISREGRLIMLTAAPGHLEQLREALGIPDVASVASATNTVNDASTADIAGIDSSRQWVQAAISTMVEFDMTLDQDAIANQIAMSPSVRHLNPDVLAQRIEDLPARMEVSARGILRVWRRV